MIWKKLLKIALLGTERSTLSTELQQELSARDLDTTQEITQLMIEAVAFYGPLQKAGWQPKKWIGEKLLPNTASNHQVVSPKSKQHLLTILSTYPKILPEYLASIQANNKCLPPELLPPLLDKSLKNIDLWEQLENSIGERGQWLISLNPAWTPLQSNFTKADWKLGTKQARSALLKKIRRENPQEGLDLLLSTWETDDLKEKAQLLKHLVIGLNPSDEAFLEECLDFSRKGIRTIAQELLILLPESQLHQRLKEQLATLVTFIPKEETILLSLPEANNKALLRDGIDPKKKGFSSKVEVNMLAQIMEIVTPTFWEKHFNSSPLNVIKLFANSDRSYFLLNALFKAIALHRNEVWIKVALDFWMGTYLQQNWEALEMKPIFDILPNELFNELLYQKLQAIKIMPDEHAPLLLLLQLDGPIWSKKLSLIVTQLLQEWMQRNPSFSYSGMGYRSMLKKQAAYAIDPMLHPKMTELWLVDQRSWAGWEQDIQRFLNILSFRKEVLMEMQK